jgi:hypothetical protein
MTGFNSKREAAADKLQEPEREALSLAMDGLERILGSFEKEGKFVRSSMIRNELFTEIHLLLVKAKKALAQPAQEPVTSAWSWREVYFDEDGIPLMHKSPPERGWVGLASEDRLCAKYMQDAPDGIEAVIDYIEAKLKEKNSGT